MNELSLPNQTINDLAVNPALLPEQPQLIYNEADAQAKQNKDTIIKPAKRLANTNQLGHNDWLAIRQTGIGGSDAAAACGLNPYMSMLELWLIKTGRAQPEANDGVPDGYAPLYWGKQLEPLVAKYYTQKTGNKVRRVNAVLQHPDTDKAFMLANLDYAVSNSDVGVLEIKTAGIYGAKNWQDGVPLYVVCQVQHQLAVTGKQLAHVCVLIGGHETKLYEVKRDDALIEQIIQAERRFWQYVESDVPPPADDSASAGRAIEQLYPVSQAQTIDFSHDESLNQCFAALSQAKQTIEQQQKIFDGLKHHIQQHMQSAEVATFAHGSISWKRSKDSITLNSKALLKDQPELLEQYPQVRAGSRRFMVKIKN